VLGGVLERLRAVLEASWSVLERLGGVLLRLGALLQAIWPDAENVETKTWFSLFWGAFVFRSLPSTLPPLSPSLPTPLSFSPAPSKQPVVKQNTTSLNTFRPPSNQFGYT
jgi:hypothetical protein